MTYQHWHRALAHALLGRDLPELGAQSVPDVAEVVAALTPYADEAREVRAVRTGRDEPWPVPPTPELAVGIPWGQYATVLHQVRDRLGLTGTVTAPRIGPTPAVTDAAGRRLLEDRPPHW